MNTKKLLYIFWGLLFIIGLFIYLTGYTNSGRRITVIFPDANMEPAIAKGSKIVIDKGVNSFSRGDIIAFTDENALDTGISVPVYKIARIIGLPNESIQISAATDSSELLINGVFQNESYVTLYPPTDYISPKIDVPQDSYYVAIDNRRSFPAITYMVNIENVIGKVIQAGL